jgi:hypothetical protein
MKRKKGWAKRGAGTHQRAGASNLLRSGLISLPPPLSPVPAFSLHPTPNPNSLKFTATDGAFIPSGMGAYSSAAEAAADPLATALFAIPGVSNVLVLPAFVTVTKRPEADWNAMLPRLEAILAGDPA